MNSHAKQASLSALLALLFFISCIYFLNNSAPIFGFPDVGWHIAAGNYVLEHQQIPTDNVFSHSHPESSWFLISWLWDVLLASMVDAFGISTLFSISVIAYGAIIALMGWYLRTNHQIADGILCVYAIITALTLVPFISVRPQLATLLFTLAFLAICSLASHKQYRFWLYCLPVIMALWVNIHGGFLVGFTIIGCFFLQHAFAKEKAPAITLLLVAIACALALLLNPKGIAIFASVLSVFDDVMRVNIHEWRPFTFGEFLGPSLMLLTFILCSFIKDQAIGLSYKLLAFIWLFASLSSMRYFPIFMIVAAPYIALRMQSLCANPGYFSFLNRFKIGDLSMLACIVLVSLLVMPAFHSSIHPAHATIKPEVLTSNAIKAINKIETDTTRIYNSYDLGGLISYYTQGELAVFVDGRAGTAYPQEFLKAVIGLHSDATSRGEIFERYNINVAILAKNDAVYNDLYQDEGWDLVFEDGSIAILSAVEEEN